MALIRSLPLFLFIFAIATAKIIHIPPLTIEDPLYLRLGDLQQIDASLQPFGTLSKIYKKEVVELVNQKETGFGVCYQTSPQVEFYSESTKPITSLVERNGLIHDFDSMYNSFLLSKYPRSLVDMAVHGNKVFYMLENGVIKTDKIVKNYKQLVQFKSYQSAQTKVGLGNFVVMENSTNGNRTGFGIFINHNQAIAFDLDAVSFVPIAHFPKTKTFGAAVYLGGNFIAVAYGTTGVRIYSINFEDYTLNQEAEINESNSGAANLNAKDLSFDPIRKILFILDYNSGILSYFLSFSPFVYRIAISSLKNTLCNLLFYDKTTDDLYLNCRELHRYRLAQWPIIEEKVLPKQDISVRDIVANRELLVLVGRDVFEVLTADRKAAAYQSALLDKLILGNDYFISADQYEIMIGNYTLAPPALYCYSTNNSDVGIHRLLLRVTAQCSTTYLSSINFNLTELAPQDQCIYSLLLNLHVWEPAFINTTPFLIVGVFLIIMGLAIMGWWLFSFFSFRKLQHHLDNYQDLEEEGVGGMESGSEKKSSEGNLDPAKPEQQKSIPKQQPLQEDIVLQNNELHDIQ